MVQVHRVKEDLQVEVLDFAEDFVEDSLEEINFDTYNRVFTLK